MPSRLYVPTPYHARLRARGLEGLAAQAGFAGGFAPPTQQRGMRGGTPARRRGGLGRQASQSGLTSKMLIRPDGLISKTLIRPEWSYKQNAYKTEVVL